MDPYFVELLARSPREILAVDIVAKATLVLAAAGAVALALRRSSAASRHLAWCLGLGAALVLPVLSLALPGMVLARPAGRDGDRPTPTDRRPTPRPRSRTAGHGSAVARRDRPRDEEALRRTPARRVASRPGRRPARPRRPFHPGDVLTPSWSWLWAAWLAGAVTVLSAPMAGRIALRRWAREAEPIVGDDWTALLADCRRGSA